MGVLIGGLSLERAHTPIVEVYDFTALSENPLSLSGRVQQGGTDALDWQNMKSVSGKGVTGTGSQNPGGGTGYTDCICRILPPSGQAWGTDQDLWGRVGVDGTAQASFGGFHEMEFHLRVTYGPHSVKMYEVLFSLGPQWYIEIVRWRGPLALANDGVGYVSLANSNLATAPVISNGHYCRANITGTVITGYHKTTLGGAWVPYVQHDIGADTEMWTSGDIGMGNWDNGAGNFDDYWWETLNVAA